MAKVIITGAGGFLGSALTKKYVDDGTEVITISQYYNPSFPESPLIRKHTADIDDREKLLKIIPDDEYLAFYHLAWRGVNGPEKADPFIQLENIRMTLICASVAAERKCRKYLCAGTVAERAVESLPELKATSGGMAYSTAKHCAHLLTENYCKNVGLDFVWMQFSNIYGPHNKTGNLISYTLNQVLSGNEARFGPAKQPYDFIFVDDVIEAVYRIGIRDTKRNFYFIGSGESRLLRDYLTTVGEMCEKPELIKLNARPDDGVQYSSDMFDTTDLKEDIGEYITAPFEEHIKYTIDNY